MKLIILFIKHNYLKRCQIEGDGNNDIDNDNDKKALHAAKIKVHICDSAE